MFIFIYAIIHDSFVNVPFYRRHQLNLGILLIPLSPYFINKVAINNILNSELLIFDTYTIWYKTNLYCSNTFISANDIFDYCWNAANGLSSSLVIILGFINIYQKMELNGIAHVLKCLKMVR